MVLLLALGYNYLADQHLAEKTEVQLMQTNTIIDSSNRLMAEELDSVNIRIDGLAQGLIYLDSCQQNRTAKTDRAERRGKFVGGLIKGLFPSL